MRSDPSKNAQCSFLLHSYPRLFPLLEQHLGISRDQIVSPREVETLTLPPTIKNEAFITRVKRILEPTQVAFDKAARIKGSLGSGSRDALKLRAGDLGRITDMVLYPRSHDQVQKLVTLACEYDVVLIPAGNGANKVGSLTPLESETRMIVSLDLSGMNQVLAIDEQSQIVIVEAGATTQQLQKILKQFNLTPCWDSNGLDNSTIGGRVSVGSSLTSVHCGDSQDALLNCRIATPMGSIDSQVKSSISHPLSIENLVVGSEGTLGIITELAVAVRPIPARPERWVISFPNFECGTKALHQMVLDGCMPSTCRLFDQPATELIGKLEVTGNWAKKLVDRLNEWYLEKQGHQRSCLLALEFLGTSHIAHEWRSRALACCQRNQGIVLSQRRAAQIAQTRAKLPYLRNLLFDHQVMVDSLSATVSWNNLVQMQQGVVEGINQSLLLWDKKGAVICDLSAISSAGVHLNFHFATLQSKGRELEQLEIIRTDAAKLIRTFGGSLYLGHGIGTLNQPFIKQELGEAALEGMKALKRKIDPQNVMNPGKSFAQRRETVVNKQLVEPITSLPRRQRFIQDKAAALVQ